MRPVELVRSRWRTAVRFCAAVAIGAAVAGAIWLVYPDELRADTDTVGYPIFYDFNIQGYLLAYALGVGLFPVVSIAAYYGLWRLFPGPNADRPEPAVAKAAEPADAERPYEDIGWGIVRTALVGILWGAIVMIGWSPESDLFPGVLIPTAVYAAIAAGIAAALSGRIGEPIPRVLSGVNAIGAVTAIVGVGVASATTEMHVVEAGRTVDYPFLPLWVSVAALVAACALTVNALGRDRDWYRVESRVLFLVAAPVALFLVLAQLPGASTSFDFFHHGERLGASTLVAEGAFPWRDLMFTHGPMPDVLIPLFDTSSFENSLWGFNAGAYVLFNPLVWISTYFLFLFLFRENWVFLVGVFLFVALGGLQDLVLDRLILMPFVLLSFAALLARATWWRAAAFALTTVVQLLLVPEAIPLSAAPWVGLVAYELVERERGASLAQALQRTSRAALVAIAALAAFAGYLVANDAVDGLVDWYRALLGGHAYAGGIPIQWGGPGSGTIEYAFWVIAPLVVIFVTWWYAAARIGARRSFTVTEWVVGVSVLALIGYYLKFVARADDHVFQVATLALVPLLYILYRLVNALDRRLTRLSPLKSLRHPATAGLVLGAIALAPLAADTTVQEIPGRFNAYVSVDPQLERLGYYAGDTSSVESSIVTDIGGDAVPTSLVTKTERIVDRYAGESGSMFDFTNSPALFGYLVETDLATRFFNVNIAISATGQRLLIEELERERPELVVYSSSALGLPVWDGIPASVRHYLVSDYLLDNYVPIKHFAGYVFMVPRDGGEPADESLYFEGQNCDWGYAPNFLADAPADGAEAAAVAIARSTPTVRLNGHGWAIDTETAEPAKHILVARDDTIVAQAATGVYRPDIQAAYGGEQAAFAGFDFSGLTLPHADPPEAGLRVYAETRDGAVEQISPPDAGAPASLSTKGGRRIEVSSGSVRGNVDSIEAVPQETTVLELPADAAGYDWLEVDGETESSEVTFEIEDHPGEGRRSILFRELAETDPVQVRVGSCPQWRGYTSGRVLMSAVGGARPERVRLLR